MLHRGLRADPIPLRYEPEIALSRPFAIRTTLRYPHIFRELPTGRWAER